MVAFIGLMTEEIIGKKLIQIGPLDKEHGIIHEFMQILKMKIRYMY